MPAKMDIDERAVDVPSYYAGYYDAAEELLNWMKGRVCSRKEMERKLVDMQPRRLKDGPS